MIDEAVSDVLVFCWADEYCKLQRLSRYANLTGVLHPLRNTKHGIPYVLTYRVPLVSPLMCPDIGLFSPLASDVLTLHLLIFRKQCAHERAIPTRGAHHSIQVMLVPSLERRQVHGVHTRFGCLSDCDTAYTVWTRQAAFKVLMRRAIVSRVRDQALAIIE